LLYPYGVAVIGLLNYSITAIVCNIMTTCTKYFSEVNFRCKVKRYSI